MHIVSYLAAVTAFLSIPVSLASPTTACTAAYRESYLNGVAPAFSNQVPGATAAFIQSLPLDSTATLTLYIDGLPGIEVAPSADTVRNFALLVRQFFYKVTGPPAQDYGNGTDYTPLSIDTGLLHVIALPITFEAGLIFNYNLQTCLIESVVGILTIPTKIAGQPIPTIQEYLQQLAAQAQSMKKL